jgi:hypothetical protein
MRKGVSMKHTDKYRESALQKIASGRVYLKIEKVTYEIEGKRFHIKVKTGNLKKYPFNINDTVLAADYEVYVCGTQDLYYVVPVELIKQMHTEPSAMPDNTHPGLTIIDIYPAEDIIIYGTGGKSLSIVKFRNITL